MTHDSRRPIDDDATVVRAAPTNPTHPARSSRPATVSGADAPLPEAGGNRLVRAANPILLLASQLRTTLDMPDIGVLRERAVDAVKRFDAAAEAAGADRQAAMTARYVLCTMLDESILDAPWGDQTGWQRQTLLVSFHGETYGGEKFFLILEHLSRDMLRHIDLVELMYLCLALGFGGRYLVEPGGLARLADLREDVYARIKAYRGTPPEALSTQWRGLDRPLLSRRGWPVGLALLAGLVVVGGVWVFLHSRLNGLGAPANAVLADIGLHGVPLPSTPVGPAPAPARLRDLLGDDARNGLVTVEDNPDGRSVLHLAATGMFPSGGADVAAKDEALIGRIGKVLDSLRGRIVVVGHTDDQPIRSTRFKDNFELSTARAKNVGAILARQLADPRRIETSGAGDSQPVATPPSLPANRARNRRVDILFIPEAG